MDQNATKEGILAHAKQFKTKKEWKSVYASLGLDRPDRYISRRHGREWYLTCVAHMAKKCRFKQPNKSKCAKWRKLDPQTALDSAKQFQTRKDWQSHLKLPGNEVLRQFVKMSKPEFYHQCTAHMTRAKTARTHFPKTAWWRKLSEPEIIASGKKFAHLVAWMRREGGHFAAARAKGETFFRHCTKHMSVPGLTWGNTHAVYAFLFEDGYAYVGLSYCAYGRWLSHTGQHADGPVFEHIKVCPNFTFTVIVQDLTPMEAKRYEWAWWKVGVNSGLNMLNEAPPGSLGSIQCSQYTDEFIIAEARKYKTKAEWRKHCGFRGQMSRDRGIWEQCVAHMPRKAAPSVPIPSQKLRGFTLPREYYLKFCAEKGIEPDPRSAVLKRVRCPFMTQEEYDNFQVARRRAWQAEFRKTEKYQANREHHAQYMKEWHAERKAT